MSCIVWNARGLGNPRAFGELRHLVKERKPSLLFLSETRMVEHRSRHWRDLLGFVGHFVVNCQGKSGGLMLLWNQTMSVSVKSFSQGHIDCIVHEDNKVWRFIGFYGNPEASMRKFSWDLLKRLSSIREIKELPWLVGGDFNEICYDSEKKGGRLRANAQMAAIQETMEFCEHRSMHARGEFFTWVGRNQGEIPIFERLDRFLHSEGWCHLYPTVFATNLEFYHLDHRPASARKARNTIRGLMSSHGDFYSDKEVMLEIIIDYFERLFKTDSPSHEYIQWVTECLNPVVDVEMNDSLNMPFSSGEVKKAVFELGPDQAPGPDGMTCLFLKFWRIVGQDVTQAALRILNEGASLEEWNQTVITLIPKVKNPLMVKEFRPISLCNSRYKIIVVALANRMKKMMPIVIDDFKAFVKGRLI
ncbi:hypothetical protein DH2020_024763 [Rehmannia glutinosa]|uniref:Endonuclease/exonuclease/phosphatase domain-containing protein n=1 Tax=Rehmannia glutinosa TaxID=99300 RepID=A0ABR0W4D7_REHGL